MTDTTEETAQALTARQQMEEVWGETMEDGRGRPSEILDDQPSR